MKEAYPLAWPVGWPRTRIQDREIRSAWKKTERQSIEALELELKRFGVLSSTLTRKDPSDFRGPADPCPLPSPMRPWRLTDGLTRSWEGERVFCNPPYGPGILKWIRKAKEASIAVYLLPARTDTVWWHGWALEAEEVRFIKGRLRFGGSNNSAPFPSVVLVFRNETESLHKFLPLSQDEQAARQPL